MSEFLFQLLVTGMAGAVAALIATPIVYRHMRQQELRLKREVLAALTTDEGGKSPEMIIRELYARDGRQPGRHLNAKIAEVEVILHCFCMEGKATEHRCFEGSFRLDEQEARRRDERLKNFVGN